MEEMSHSTHTCLWNGLVFDPKSLYFKFLNLIPLFSPFLLLIPYLFSIFFLLILILLKFSNSILQEEDQWLWEEWPISTISLEFYSWRKFPANLILFHAHRKYLSWRKRLVVERMEMQPIFYQVFISATEFQFHTSVL